MLPAPFPTTTSAPRDRRAGEFTTIGAISRYEKRSGMRREVSAELEVEITVAPHPNTEVFESLRFVLNGQLIQPFEMSGTHGNRIHKFDAGVGTLNVTYEATIVGQTDPAPVTEFDQSMYLRPSRYAEADKFYG